MICVKIPVSENNYFSAPCGKDSSQKDVRKWECERHNPGKPLHYHLPKRFIISTNPATADAMPPMRYHMVVSVKCPVKKLLNRSPKDRDAVIPRIIKIIPPANKTNPIIL